jgi:hypothetical protein
MYLTIPVPNPSTRVIRVNFASSNQEIYIKLAVTINKDETIEKLIHLLEKQLVKEKIIVQNKHIGLKLYEVIKFI